MAVRVSSATSRWARAIAASCSGVDDEIFRVGLPKCVFGGDLSGEREILDEPRTTSFEPLECVPAFFPDDRSRNIFSRCHFGIACKCKGSGREG